MHQNQKLIQYLSQEIETNPDNKSLIYQRSQIFTIQGQIDKAISDSTKLILLEGSRSHYVQRSQLFRTKGMFVEALKDLQTAKDLPQQQEEETAIDIFLQKSTCMSLTSEVEEMAHIIQTNHFKQEQTHHYNQTIAKLLQVRVIQQLEEQHQKQIQQLKIYYEQQTKQLKEFFLKQLEEVKTKLSYVHIDYESKFIKQLSKQQLTEYEKKKLKLYFKSVASEMEKYYIAAKHLHRIQDSSISFQDFSRIVSEDKKKDYLIKIYKVFDQYSSQIGKIEQLIEYIPFIGTSFKIIKASMKAKGWIENFKLQKQCQNIESLAPNITSFNQYATNLAYYLVKHYQKQILSTKPAQLNRWQVLILALQKIKEEKLGLTKYCQPLTEDQNSVKNYAIVHGSIIMISSACRHLLIDRQRLLDINSVYKQNQEQASKQLQPLFEVISSVEAALKSSKENNGNDKEGDSRAQGSKSKGITSLCGIY